VTVSLSAVVVNSGNTTPFRPVTVTFYSDAGLTTPIAATTFTGLGGCAWRERVVTVTWPSLATGRYFFWVQVDSSDVVTESDESDNVALGVVLVNPQQLYLPLALRG
jgi:subtilase family serine protease